MYIEFTEKNVCIQRLEFYKSLKLDLKDKREVKTSSYIAFCNILGSTFDFCILSFFNG